MRSLLDVNVVISLLDPDHDFHQRAHAWWGEHSEAGWASCPMTENGVVRVMAHPGYNPERSLTVTALSSLLRRFAAGTNHEFWPDAVSILDDAFIDTAKVLGPRQITDVYLLALAASRGGRLVTFDESVHAAAVPQVSGQHLLVI